MIGVSIYPKSESFKFYQILKQPKKQYPMGTAFLVFKLQEIAAIMIIEIPSFRHHELVYRYKLSESQANKYNSIVGTQKLTPNIVHKLLVFGCLTQEIREW